ncbi:hypothetical protein C8J56DRAFT_1049453 [Mycena floridula]|nr:hypothetical protein C8J56DRAFT_1049453 [Mycena floridula]
MSFLQISMMAMTVPCLIFIINVIVIITMSYAMSGAIQDKIYTDGTGWVGPMIAIITSSISIIFITIILLLIQMKVVISLLASILMDGLCLAAYISGIYLTGEVIDWQFLGSHVRGLADWGHDLDALLPGTDSGRLRQSNTFESKSTYIGITLELLRESKMDDAPTALTLCGENDIIMSWDKTQKDASTFLKALI